MRIRGYLLVPVGQGHHDVEGGQEEAEVEEGVAVGDTLLFVVHGPSHSVLARVGLGVCGQALALFSLHQLVHLGVVGGADAAAYESANHHQMLWPLTQDSIHTPVFLRPSMFFPESAVRFLKHFNVLTIKSSDFYSVNFHSTQGCFKKSLKCRRPVCPCRCRAAH